MDKVIELSKSYGFKHYNTFNIFSKVNDKNDQDSSKVLNTPIIKSNFEYLIMSVKGDWKKVLR